MLYRNLGKHGTIKLMSWGQDAVNKKWIWRNQVVEISVLN